MTGQAIDSLLKTAMNSFKRVLKLGTLMANKIVCFLLVFHFGSELPTARHPNLGGSLAPLWQSGGFEGRAAGETPSRVTPSRSCLPSEK